MVCAKSGSRRLRYLKKQKRAILDTTTVAFFPLALRSILGTTTGFFLALRAILDTTTFFFLLALRAVLDNTTFLSV